MPPFDESLIERYVRQPGALSAQERRVAVEVLETHPAARALADTLQTFYREFDALEETDAPRVERFMEGLFPEPRVIPLRPFRSEPHDAGSSHKALLAAMSPSAQERFETVATLASEAHGVLVRLLCDRSSNTYRLYTLAENEERRAHVVISFPELALNLVTDEQGRVDFSLNAEAVDWTSIRAVLRLPVATWEVSPRQLEGGAHTDQIASGYEGTCTLDDDRLSVTVAATEDEASALSLAVVEHAGDKTWVPLEEGEGSVNLSASQERIIIRLYE